MANDTHRGGKGLTSGEADGLGATVAAIATQVNSVLPTATRVLSENYTILTSDKVVYLKSTTSGGDHTITFAAGLDGQKVVLLVVSLSGSDEFVIAGVEGDPSNLERAAASMTMVYDLAEDKWSVASKENHTQIRRLSDENGVVLENDKLILVTTTVSTGDYTLTFNKSHDGHEVTVFMITQDGDDKYDLQGTISAQAKLNAFEDFATVRYSKGGDFWFFTGFKFTV